MTPIFYAHLVPLEETLSMLDKYEFVENEKHELEELIHSMFDHRVLQLILFHLPAEHHDDFMRYVADNPSDLNIIVFIKQHVPPIDEYIQDVGKQLELELRGLLHKTKGM